LNKIAYRISKEAGELLKEIGIVKSVPDVTTLYDTQFIK